jgi:hypothetical protein
MLEKINHVFLYTVFGQDKNRNQGERKKMNVIGSSKFLMENKTKFAGKARKKRKCFCEDFERICWNFGKDSSRKIHEVHLHG